VHTDERETNSLNENIMDFGVYENVVNVKVRSKYIRYWGREVSGAVGSGVVRMLVLEDLVSLCQLNVNETLSIWNGDGWDR
jgi:hypothetical protein